ncbi:hypothetical protein GCM10011613_01180 [Cellvibrio zantedeschiae]|uniref:Helix-turn-helix domain-containing protein n=1 Tax=Cellvibrio zantedeschiae TaxID=1237077 RepID=A0ABQ3AN59_9GAMM|nr:hypothetical protein GCM10011613_01180 [Cellvibrio zantedeschiae]
MIRQRNLLPRDQAAEYLSVKPQTLAAWATTGRYDLPFIKIGRKVFYALDELESFIERRTYTSTP